MKTKILTSLALMTGLAVIASPLFAHHGDAAYASQPLVLKGCVVKEFNWMNPHSLIKFDYKNEKGELQHWTMEIGSPPSMTAPSLVRIARRYAPLSVRPTNAVLVCKRARSRHLDPRYVRQSGVGSRQRGNLDGRACLCP